MFEAPEAEAGASPYKQNEPSSRVSATQAAPAIDGGRHASFSFEFEAPEDTSLVEIALNQSGRIRRVVSAGTETLFEGSSRMFPDLSSLRRPPGELPVSKGEQILIVVEGIREEHECRVTFERPE